MDVLSKDSTQPVPQTSTANGVKTDPEMPKSESPEEKATQLQREAKKKHVQKDLEMPKSESLEEKAVRVQREAKEELQELQSKEQCSKQVLVTRLQQLQSRWTSGAIPVTVFNRDSEWRV